MAGRRTNPFDTRIWSRIIDYINYSLPAIASISGIILVISSYFFIDSESGWASAINTVGITILSAGVFSATVKSRFFSEIFSNIVSDVVHGHEFLMKRRDLEELWKNVSHEICDREFPELKDEIHHRIITEMLPRNRDHYYEYIERHFISEPSTA
jgi:hypothetical protein